RVGQSVGSAGQRTRRRFPALLCRPVSMAGIQRGGQCHRNRRGVVGLWNLVQQVASARKISVTSAPCRGTGVTQLGYVNPNLLGSTPDSHCSSSQAVVLTEFGALCLSAEVRLAYYRRALRLLFEIFAQTLRTLWAHKLL